MTKTGLIIVGLVFIASSSLFAQEKIIHPKTMYKSPTGRMFIQKSLLPTYHNANNKNDS